MPVFNVQSSGAMPFPPGDAYGVGTGKFGAPTTVSWYRRSRPPLPVPNGGQCPGLDRQSPLGHGCNWLTGLGYTCAEWRLLTQGQRIDVVRNRLLDILDWHLENQEVGLAAARRDVADRGLQNQIVGWMNDWCLQQGIRDVRQTALKTTIAPGVSAKPSGAVSFGVGDAYGVGVGKFGAPTIVTPTPGTAWAGEHLQFLVTWELSPSADLHGMNLTCAQWRALGWNNRLASLRVYVDRMNAALANAGSGGRYALDDQEVARHAHAIDAYCLGQGIRNVKASGAIMADYPALPWLGGAAVGSVVTYFAMKMRSKR